MEGAIFCIVGISVVALLIYWGVKAEELRQKKIAFVFANSRCIREISKINSHYSFKKIEANPCFQRSCNSKAQLDNFNIENHMLATINDSKAYFDGMVKAVKYNRERYQKYKNEYDSVMRNTYGRYDYDSITVNSIITSEEFKKMEYSECQKLKKDAVKDFTITLKVEYTSPKGRNSYWRTYTFNCANIEQYLGMHKIAQQNKQTADYQRQLMTPKLRYKIMKRDGFKCVICGRSQKEGAQLHVDHIKPVSKGGKTVESNLRTLCDMCNLGKSDEYDPYGPN
ncbi:MAG: HNH endonuclease [Cyanobacteria bacterium RUI128]|nr:HNH endonuclease [Cyanobacteria bacterium RUI128]